jgi:hypothetical protein
LAKIGIQNLPADSTEPLGEKHARQEKGQAHRRSRNQPKNNLQKHTLFLDSRRADAMEFDQVETQVVNRFRTTSKTTFRRLFTGSFLDLGWALEASR